MTSNNDAVILTDNMVLWTMANLRIALGSILWCALRGGGVN